MAPLYDNKKNGFLLIEILLGLFMFSMMTITDLSFINTISLYSKRSKQQHDKIRHAQNNMEAWLAHHPLQTENNNNEEQYHVEAFGFQLEKLTIKINKTVIISGVRSIQN